MSGYLADTSGFVAAEQRCSLGRAPEGEAQDDDFDVLAELDAALVSRG